jgi:hypothetical protein
MYTYYKHARMYTYMDTWIFIYIYEQTWGSQGLESIHIYIHIYMYICMYENTYTYIHIYIHTWIFIIIYIHIRIFIYIYMHMNKPEAPRGGKVYKYIYICIKIHIHTYIHTFLKFIYIYMNIPEAPRGWKVWQYTEAPLSCAQAKTAAATWDIICAYKYIHTYIYTYNRGANIWDQTIYTNITREMTLSAFPLEVHATLSKVLAGSPAFSK